MNEIDLDEVIALCEVARDDEGRTWHDRQDAIWQLLDVGGTVPALVDEVRLLRKERDSYRRSYLDLHEEHRLCPPKVRR